MTMASNQIDLERKTENAFAARLKQHPALSRMRMRNNSEDSPRVNQDIVITAKRGEGNPPYSGVYNVAVELTVTMRHRKGVDTLPKFLATCAAMEDVFNTTAFQVINGFSHQEIALQLSLAVPNFHCYELAVTGKDDTPEDKKHKCVWSVTVIAMSQSYATATNLQPH